MQKSRLIEVLKSFSKQEMQQFLVSPYHNKRTDIVRLYEHINFAFRENLEDMLDKKYTHDKLFPKRPYKDLNMRLVMYDLLRHRRISGG